MGLLTKVIRKIKEYGKLVMFSHTIFSFSFALVSMVLAAKGLPKVMTLVWILVCFLGARTGANANRSAGFYLYVTTDGVPGAVLDVSQVAIGSISLRQFPFIIEPAYAVHRRRTERLAASLGLHGVSRLRLIDWPGLRKPFFTALSFAMALSLGDLGAVALFGSDSLMTLPWLVYSKLGSYRTNDADGYALILGLLCLLLTIAGTAGQGTDDHESRRHD